MDTTASMCCAAEVLLWTIFREMLLLKEQKSTDVDGNPLA